MLKYYRITELAKHQPKTSMQPSSLQPPVRLDDYRVTAMWEQRLWVNRLQCFLSAPPEWCHTATWHPHRKGSLQEEQGIFSVARHLRGKWLRNLSSSFTDGDSEFYPVVQMDHSSTTFQEGLLKSLLERLAGVLCLGASLLCLISICTRLQKQTVCAGLFTVEVGKETGEMKQVRALGIAVQSEREGVQDPPGSSRGK